jgi:hypothetical protein
MGPIHYKTYRSSYYNLIRYCVSLEHARLLDLEWLANRASEKLFTNSKDLSVFKLLDVHFFDNQYQIGQMYKSFYINYSDMSDTLSKLKIAGIR